VKSGKAKPAADLGTLWQTNSLGRDWKPVKSARWRAAITFAGRDRGWAVGARGAAVPLRARRVQHHGHEDDPEACGGVESRQIRAVLFPAGGVRRNRNYGSCFIHMKFSAVAF
jgi:hypothetical protein